jgi:hypothetical protein
MKTKPNVNDRKIPRSVSIRQSIDRIVRENGIDLGSIIEDAVLKSCGTDPEEMELQRLEKEISKLKSELASKISRAEYLKESVSRKKRLQTDLLLERECHGWYLRSLIQSGIFRVMRKESIDPSVVIQQLLADGNISKFDIENYGNGWRLTSNASRKAIRYLSHFLDKYGNISPTEEKVWVTPGQDDLLSKYSISVDFEKLSSEIISNRQIGDEPVEFYLQFNPRIVSERVKTEIKKKMEPEYMPARVEVSERGRLTEEMK